MSGAAFSHAPAFDLYELGDHYSQDSWLVSDWAAGQSNILQWSPQNVRVARDGAVELVLDRAAGGAARPFHGGEIQSAEAATTGTWGWTAQAPEMVSGAVFGMFTYKDDWSRQPWVEFDFEFVGRDTRRVYLDIHMEDGAGRHVTLTSAARPRAVVDLGFDAAQGQHLYEVTVTDDSAIFRVDGRTVAEFTSADMQGGHWNIGPMRGYADLWAVPKGQESWAGKWTDPGRPLVARLSGGDVRPDEYHSEYQMAPGGGDDRIAFDGLAGVLDGGGGIDTLDASRAAGVTIDLDRIGLQKTGQGDLTIMNFENVVGGAGRDRLFGNSAGNDLSSGDGNDQLEGRGGDDTLNGGAGSDKLSGGGGNDLLLAGAGNDLIFLDAGDDVIDGGTGKDRLAVSGAGAATIDLAVTKAQDTGSGMDVIRNIESLSGGHGNDRLSGNGLKNQLTGGDGNDTLAGAGGADDLEGGAGADLVFGGVDLASDRFVFRTVADSPADGGRDRIGDFVSGIDLIDLSHLDADSERRGQQDLVFADAAGTAHALWASAAGNGVLVQADVTGDGKADFEVLVLGLKSLDADDFLF
ncbi:MAG: family 16 glycosylhydrolase [Paracoccus sp. (in: a-proteobacteria)]|uniref:family 16 glycosylhydrolase n=1 Tax=Paracoccus sp. TaxID=267 RepID=UPI00405A0B51